MACNSGSVQSVADKTVAAKNQIDKLQTMILAQEADNKARFYAEIEGHLKDRIEMVIFDCAAVAEEEAWGPRQKPLT